MSIYYAGGGILVLVEFSLIKYLVTNCNDKCSSFEAIKTFQDGRQ